MQNALLYARINLGNRLCIRMSDSPAIRSARRE